MSEVTRRGLLPNVGYKSPVVTASTANIDLTIGEATVDGVVIALNDRVLVKDQTDPTENGIYNATLPPWKRAQDFNDRDDAVNGVQVLNVNDGNIYRANFTGAWLPGTTSITFDSIFDSVTFTNASFLGSTTFGDGVTGIVNIDGGPTTSSQIRFFDQGVARARIGVATGTTGLALSGSDTLTPDIFIDAAGNVTVTGTFTSLGIDDNATLEMLSVDDTSIGVGPSTSASSYHIDRRINNGDLIISGGTISTTGGNIKMYGGTHATQANETEFYQATTLALTLSSVGHATFAEKVIFDASTTADPSFNVPEGVAPTTPVDGDFWITAAGAANMRLNGVTVDLAAGGIGGSITDNQVAIGATTAGDIEGSAAFTYDSGTSLLDMGFNSFRLGQTFANQVLFTNPSGLGNLEMTIENGGQFIIRDGNTGNTPRYVFDIDSGDLQMDGNLDLTYIDGYAGTPSDGQILTWVTANGRAEFTTGGGGGIGGTIADNQVARGALTANDIEGSSTLTFDGITLKVGNTTSNAAVDIDFAGSSTGTLGFDVGGVSKGSISVTDAATDFMTFNMGGNVMELTNLGLEFEPGKDLHMGYNAQIEIGPKSTGYNHRLYAPNSSITYFLGDTTLFFGRDNTLELMRIIPGVTNRGGPKFINVGWEADEVTGTAFALDDGCYFYKQGITTNQTFTFTAQNWVGDNQVHMFWIELENTTARNHTWPTMIWDSRAGHGKTDADAAGRHIIEVKYRHESPGTSRYMATVLAKAMV